MILWVVTWLGLAGQFLCWFLLGSLLQLVSWWINWGWMVWGWPCSQVWWSSGYLLGCFSSLPHGHFSKLVQACSTGGSQGSKLSKLNKGDNCFSNLCLHHVCCCSIGQSITMSKIYVRKKYPRARIQGGEPWWPFHNTHISNNYVVHLKLMFYVNYISI